MTSQTTRRFRELCEALNPETRKLAANAFKRFRENPHHPGLRFKRVGAAGSTYSIRVSKSFRALGVMEGDVLVWFWIGSHDEYEKILRAL